MLDYIKYTNGAVSLIILKTNNKISYALMYHVAWRLLSLKNTHLTNLKLNSIRCLKFDIKNKKKEEKY